MKEKFKWADANLNVVIPMAGLDSSDRFWSLGTPEELNCFLEFYNK